MSVGNALLQSAEPVHAGILPEPACPSGEPPVVVIRPARGWQLVHVGEMWRYRELLYFLTWRDVKVRYKQTALGAAWAVLQPLAMMAVFTLFFSRLAHLPSGDLPYALFVFAGLLPWTFFATAVANGGNSVVGSERLITKVYFPRLVIPFASVGAALVDFLVALGLLVVMAVAYGRVPGVSLLLAPLVLAALVLAAAGVGSLLAALNVAYRDFRYVIPFLVQLWLFATPAVYVQTPADAPAGLALLLTLNPLNGLVAAFRATALGGSFPAGDFALSAAFAVLLFLVGCGWFSHTEDRFADVI